MRVIYTGGIGLSENGMTPEVMAKNIGLPYKIFEYQDIMEKRSDKLLEKHLTYGGPMMQKGKQLLYDYAGDETLYLKNRDAILKKLDDLVATIPFHEELVFVSHSMGSVIFYDYIIKYWNLRQARLMGIVTMGCPLPLLRGENYKGFFPYVKWVNYWEDSDPVSHKLFRSSIIDKEHKSYHFWKGWSWLSHVAYLKSGKLAKRIKKDILSFK